MLELAPCRDEAKDAIFYSYTRHINGFAATLEDEAAAEIASKHFFQILMLFSVQYAKYLITDNYRGKQSIPR